jgi:gluconokinase
VIVIVSGVAGSGKTTVGTMLAERLGWPFADADMFHPEANIAKMRAGIALSDADREPWLLALGRWMDVKIAAGLPGVITCSALKRAYRDRLLATRPAATMVLLDVDRDELTQRLASRPGHFFTLKLLDSQLAIYEPPAPDERVRLVREEGGPAQTAADIIALLWPDGPAAAEA